MKILVDTNVILDIILLRKPFYESSMSFVKTAIDEGDKLYASSSSITDIYYIVRKITQDKTIALRSIRNVATIFDFAEVNQACIYNSFESKLSDYEDAVMESVAINLKADLIVTRNLSDYKKSRVKFIEPNDYPTNANDKVKS